MLGVGVGVEHGGDTLRWSVYRLLGHGRVLLVIIGLHWNRLRFQRRFVLATTGGITDVVDTGQCSRPADHRLRAGEVVVSVDPDLVPQLWFCRFHAGRTEVLGLLKSVSASYAQAHARRM